MNWKIWIAIILTLIIVGCAYVNLSTANGEYQPLGRLSFVKLSNPDMYSGSPHTELATKYAQDRGSNTVLVVHFAGHTGGESYPDYLDGDVLVEELGYQDSATDYKENNSMDWLIKSSIQELIFGIPDGKFRYVSNGHIFYNLDDALTYLDELAAQHGKVGKTVIVYHGTARGGNPNIMLGCGVPLYYQIVWDKYGRLAAYYYLISGILFPYFNSPYSFYELSNAQKLQDLYNNGGLDLDTAPYSYYELENYTG